MSQTLAQLTRLIAKIFDSVHLCNKTCLKSFNISSLCSTGIIISSTGSCFTILSSFDLVTTPAILFPINSSVLWTTFLEAVFKAYSPVSNNYFLYFLSNDGNPYPLTYFLVLGSIEYCRIAKLRDHVISIY